MNVKVQIDPPDKVIRRLELDRSGAVQRFWTATVLRRIQKYMPYRSGQTIRITMAQTDINRPEIVTDTPYAKMLFYGVGKNGRPLKYTKSKNPKAGPRWDRALIAAEMPVMEQEMQAYIERRG